MSLRRTAAFSKPNNRLVDVLAAGSKVVSLNTGANGDDSPALYEQNWKPDKIPAMFKRFKKEYNTIVRDHELLPNTVSVSWVTWDNKLYNMILPFQWTFVTAPWNFEIVVRFPSDYPWKKPYYFVKTKDEAEMDMKQYFMYVTTEKFDNGTRAKPGFEESFSYVRNDAMVNFLGQMQHSPAMTVGMYISKILNDETLVSLLEMSPFTKKQSF